MFVALLSARLLYTYNTKKDGIENPEVYAFAQFKATCAVFDAPQGIERVYKNDQYGFRFHYPNDAVVCERTFPNSMASSSLEVSLFKKINFNSPTGNSGPDMTLHINDTDIDGLPDPIVLEEREGKIANKNARIQKVKSPACTDAECPTITTYQFKHKDYTFLI